MTTKDAIHELGVRFGIEAPHTEQVARLARELYDGFLASDGKNLRDRKLLTTAARLHDIGFASAPEDHVPEGACLLKDHPVDGFSPDEWLMVIGIVLLHKRDWRTMLGSDVFPEMDANKLASVKRLAAVLRIADGLDHGHIQDVGIMFCKQGKRVDRIGVRCRGHAGSADWAEGKADLWEAVFMRPLRIEGSLAPSKDLYEGFIGKKEPSVSAARRILYYLWCIMRENYPGLLERGDPDCLHDYRVALRRFRAALRMFRPVLGNGADRELDQRLRNLSSQLSPVRDAHAMLQLFQGLHSGPSADPEILSILEQDVHRENALLHSILESDENLELAPAMNRFLRIELPALERNDDARPFSKFAGPRLFPLLKKIRALDVSGLRDDDPSRLHEVRKLCRRGRYYAEFSVPALGREAKPAARQLKRLAGALGDIRDACLLAERVENKDLRNLVAQQEEEAWLRFRKAWQKLSR